MAKANAKPASKRVDSQALSVARAIADALKVADSTGSSIVTQCVAVATKVYKKQPLPKEDMDYILSNVADARGWPTDSKGKDTKVRRNRKSEVRTILAHHWLLPAAIESASKDATRFTWHDAVKLARCLNAADGNVSKALKAYAKKATGAATKLTPKLAKGQVTGYLNHVMNTKFTSKAFKEQLANLAKKHGYTLNVHRA